MFRYINKMSYVIRNIPLNTNIAFFYIHNENKVTFSEQVTLYVYEESVYEESVYEQSVNKQSVNKQNKTVKGKIIKTFMKIKASLFSRNF